MGRGKRKERTTLSTAELDALLVMTSFVSGGSPSRPLERPYMVEQARLELGEAVARVELRERGRWLYFSGPQERDYRVIGKYLFFAPEPEALIPAAVAALLVHDFHHAKLSRYRGGYPKHVLCIYWHGPERLEEMRSLAERLGLEYGGWKTDAQTRAEHEAGPR
jgi:hypothetical protein